MKYRVLRSTWILFAMFSLLTACKKDSQDAYGDGDMSFLPLSEEMNIHPLGDVITVTYTSEQDWKMKFEVNGTYQDKPSWIALSSTSGSAGTVNLEFVVSPNLSGQENKVKIIFCAINDDQTKKDKILDECTIIQQPAIIDVDENEKEFTLGWKAQEDEANTFTVKSNIEWRITLSKDEDFDLEETTGKCDKLCGKINEKFDQTDVTVSFRSMDNNLSLKNKEAVFTIDPVRRDKDGEEETLSNEIVSHLRRTVSVSQEYLIFILEKDGNRIDSSDGELKLDGFSELGKKFVDDNNELYNLGDQIVSQDFTVISEMEWTYDSDALSKVGGKLEEVTRDEYSLDDRRVIEKKLTLHMHDPNPLRNQTFEYGLKLWAVEDEEAYRTVKVGQKPYQFDLTSKNVEYENIGGESTFTINTSGPWKMETSELEWISSVEPDQGFGPREIKVVAEDRNLNFNDNVKNLKFVSELHQDLSETLEATQKKFDFEVSVDDALKELSRIDTTQYNMHVTSSGPWKMEILDASGNGNDWLDMSVLEDGKTEFAYEGQEAYAETIKVRARTKNPSEDKDRKVTVNIYSTLHAEAEGDWKGLDKDTITVTQEKFHFDIQHSQNDETEFSHARFAAYKSKRNSQTFFLKCSAYWKLEVLKGDPNWLTFDETSGDGKYLTLTMTAQTNTGDTERDVTLKIKADVDEDGKYDDEEREITVSQDGFEFKVDKSEYDEMKAFGALNSTIDDNKSVTVIITTTDEAGWEIVSVNDKKWDWVNVSQDQGEGNATVTFTPMDNPTKVSREAKLLIKSKVVDRSFPISFSQDAYKFDVESVNAHLGTFDEISDKNKTPKLVRVSCTDGALWTVKKDDWIKVTDEKGNEVDNDGTGVATLSGDATLSITTKKNNLSNEDRPGKVVIESKLGEYQEEVPVTQKMYTWSVTGMDETIQIPPMDTTYQLNVKSSGRWTKVIREGHDYITLNPGSGDANKILGTSVKLNVSKNYTDESQSAIFDIISNDYDADNEDAKHLMKTFKIIQEGYVYQVKLPETITFEADDKQPREFSELRCTDELKPYLYDVNWIHVDIKNGTLSVKVDKNDGEEEREGQVTIRSEDYKSDDDNRKKFQTVFIVKQKAAEVTEEK